MDGEGGPGPLQAQEMLMAFAARRGEPALRLALHAAVPQVLRAELVHLLRLNFVPEAGPDAAAEADVLFAPFCEDLGNGYFHFAPQARLQLLRSLDPAYGEGAAPRSVQVAGFLLSYLDRLGRDAASGQDRVRTDWLETERWSALAFLNAPGAARQLAAALKAATESDAVVARLRFAGLASALSTPLARYGGLLAYAEGVEALERGRVDQAVGLLSALGDGGLEVEGIRLREPQAVLKRVALPVQAEPELTQSGQPPLPEAREDAPRNDIFISYCADDMVWAGVVEELLKRTLPTDLNCTVHSTELPKDDVEPPDASQLGTLPGNVRVALVLASPAYFQEAYTRDVEFRHLELMAAAGHFKLTFAFLGFIDPERLGNISRHIFLNDPQHPLQSMAGGAFAKIMIRLMEELQDSITRNHLAPLAPQAEKRKKTRKAHPGLIYVSCSAKDRESHVGICIQHLRLQIREMPDLGYVGTDVFAPRSAEAGTGQDAEARWALEQASVFIPLVSHDYLTSSHCVNFELKIAVERGISIAPVILSDSPWQYFQLPGDPGWMFGRLQALPLDEHHKLRPISHWHDRDAAWSAAVEQIGEMILRPLSRKNPVRASEHGSKLMPPALPYQCNQAHVAHELVRNLGAWGPTALFLIVRGTPDDGLPEFWGQLREQYITACVSARGLRLLPDRWIESEVSRQGSWFRNAKADISAVLRRMVLGNSWKSPASSAASEALGSPDEIVPLIVPVPNAPFSLFCTLLQSLLVRIEEMPENVRLERLMLVFLLENKVAHPMLSSGISLEEYRRSHVVDLPALEQLTPPDVARWHQETSFVQYCPVDENILKDHVFGNAREVRMRQFSLAVQRLLEEFGSP